MVVLSIGLLFLLTPLVWVYSVAGLSLSPSHWRKYIPYYIIAIAIVAYSYNPVGAPDLVRYFEMLDKSSNMTLAQVNEYFHDGLVIKNSIFWFFGHLGDNHLLPAFSVGVVYGVATYITCDLAENYEVTKWIPVILLYQFMVLPLISITNNIRNIFAFSLIILATYLDSVKKKRNIWVLALYILPCFVHTSGVILIFFRVLAIVAKKIKIPALCAGIFLSTIINWLYVNIRIFAGTGGVNTIIRSLITKGYWYINDKETTAWARTVAASGTSQAIRFVMMTVMLIFIVLIYYNAKKQYEKSSCSTFSTFMYLVCIIALACNAITTPQYWRFAAACNIMSAAVFIPILKNWKKSQKYIRIIVMLLTVCMVMLFALYVRSSSYNTNFGDLLGNVFLNNIYVITYRFLRGLVFF